MEIQIDINSSVVTFEEASHTDLLMTINRATQIEVELPYSHLIKDTTIQLLNMELERHKQFLTQYREQVIPRAEHQELLQKYKELATTEDKTHAEHRMEKKKTKKL